MANKKSKKPCPEASRRAKNNKSNGNRSESSLVKKLNKWGIEAMKTPKSGTFKDFTFGGQTFVLSGDIIAFILKKIRKIENKYRKTDNEKFYNLSAEDIAVIIEGFCVLMNEKLFYTLIVDGEVPKTIVIPNKEFVTLANYFNQDNADIISLQGYKQREHVFAITLQLWDEFRKPKKKRVSK